MKELNRREFLTLSGAAIVALSLAGCGGGSSAPPAPVVPTGKEAKVLEAINLFRKEKGWGELKLDSILNNAAEKYAEFAQGEIDEETVFETVIRLDSTRENGQYVNLAFTNPADMRPYCDEVAKMKEDLLTHNPEYLPVIKTTDPAKLTLVGIKVFTYPHDGKEYWYAVAAEGKK